MTASEAASRLRRFASVAFPTVARAPHGPVVKGVLSTMLDVRDIARADFLRNRSITRKIWGAEATKSTENFEPLLTVLPVKLRGDLVQVTVQLRGIPALIEAGGKTRLHMIHPRESYLRRTRSLGLKELRFKHRRGPRTLVGEGVLAWQGPGGMVFRRIVERHQARIPRHPVVEPLIRWRAEEIPDAVDRHLQKTSDLILEAGSRGA